MALVSLTSGTAQWSGHPFVHDKQCPIQARSLHGHLYLLDAGIQSSLPGLLSGEDSVAMAADLSRRWTHSRSSRCKACGRLEDGFKQKRRMHEEYEKVKRQQRIWHYINFTCCRFPPIETCRGSHI